MLRGYRCETPKHEALGKDTSNWHEVILVTN